jgi:hypothetical protein
MTISTTWCRPIVALALLALLAMALWTVGDSSAHSSDQDEQVRVRARVQADGDIEFGLRTSEGDVQPRRRVFPASETRDIWLASTPLELANGAEVRIIARHDGDTHVEFGVRTDDPRENYLPSRNKLARSTIVGRWRISTSVSIPAPESEEAHDRDEQEDQPAPPPEPPEQSEPPEDTSEADEYERISGGHRDGLIVIDGVLGDPEAPVLIVEYGDPF